MDNVCHTLAGAALGRAGLARRTPLATATLLIGANLPDVDVLAFLVGVPALEFRRGWTHGILAMACWPLALTAAILGWDRWVRRRRDASRPGAVPRQVLLLAAISTLTHPLLDFLNTYGIRLLMPFSGRWFYGDAAFIIDPWLWLAFGGGVWLSRRAERGGAVRPARAAAAAVAIATAYIAVMLAANVVGRAIVREAWSRHRHGELRQLMVAPVPVNPLARSVVVETPVEYVRGTLRWLPRPAVTFERSPVPKHDAVPAARAARRHPAVRSFLVWSRFPFYTFDQTAGGTRVTLGDLRFPGGGLRSRAFTVSTVVREP